GNWPLIHFDVDSALLYCYWVDSYPFASPYPSRPAAFQVTPANIPNGMILGMQVSAIGDIDEDGIYSQFTRTAQLLTGSTDLAVDPVIYEQNLLEYLEPDS